MDIGDAVSAMARLSYNLAMPTRKPKRNTPKGKKTGTAAAPAGAKLQRWVDLLAALLVHRFPVTFEELAPRVPAYSAPGRTRSTLERKFERDKDELRAFGVPIESQTVERDIGPMVAYVLRQANFYLPLLCAVHDGGRATPRKSDQFGYRASADLTFEPDELAAVSEAAARVRALGDPILAADAESAMRKLAMDLPVDGATAEVTHLVPAARPNAALFEALGSAVARRKVLRFQYHAMSTDRTERRTVEPYGLFFLGSQWYLVGRDADRDALRNFRLTRMSGAEVNPRAEHTPDFIVPKEFVLREHASSRQAWELGDADAASVTVRFAVKSGAAAAAAKLGAPVAGKPDQRRFDVRRIDNFALWLLSFAGEATPVEPASLTAAWRKLAERTRAMYE